MDTLGSYYDLAFAPSPSLASLHAEFPTESDAMVAARFTRELAVQGEPYWSSGAITIPALNGPGGAPIAPPAPATGVIRYSCGATLISPSYVLTAGHCVDTDHDVSNIRLHMYRPTPGLVATYPAATQLSGSWPLFTHATLSEADGYLSDEYSCELVRRCYAGSDLNCPSTNTDAALLLCAGRPGDRYGFLNLSVGDPTGKEALMQWKHEVLAVPSNTATGELYDHYVAYPSSPEQNYHYFDNQLLPLRSIVWPGGTPTRFLDSAWSNILGCHGSSGSGLLARVDGTPVFGLVGPVALGGLDLGDHLCSAYYEGVSYEGQQSLGVSIAPTMLSGDAAAIRADCSDHAAAARDVDDLPFAAGSHHISTLFSHLDCQIDVFAQDGRITADAVLGPYPEKYVDPQLTNAQLVVRGFSVDAGAAYRLGVHSLPLAACGSSCGAIDMRVGDDSRAIPAPAGSGAALVTRLLSPATAGAVEIGLSTTGTPHALGAFVWIREGQVNSFDVLEDRLEAALYALADPSIPPQPMRFVGDGTAAFAALLYPAERMALLRQAIAPGQRWTVRIGADSYDDLYCGLLDMQGAPVGRTLCSARLVTIDDTAGMAGRLGFYVELDAKSARSSALIRYVALASGAAPDADGDGIADVLDTCPGDADVHCNEPDYVAPSAPDADMDAGQPVADAGVDAGTSTEPQPHEPSHHDAGGTSRDAGAPTTGVAGAASHVDAGSAIVGEPAKPDAAAAVTEPHRGEMPGDATDASGCGCRIGPQPADSRVSLLTLLLACALAARYRARRARRVANGRSSCTPRASGSRASPDRGSACLRPSRSRSTP